MAGAMAGTRDAAPPVVWADLCTGMRVKTGPQDAVRALLEAAAARGADLATVLAQDKTHQYADGLASHLSRYAHAPPTTALSLWAPPATDCGYEAADCDHAGHASKPSAARVESKVEGKLRVIDTRYRRGVSERSHLFRRIRFSALSSSGVTLA